MPYAAPKPCNRHPRVVLHRGQQCPQCTQTRRREYKDRQAKRGPRVYDTARWKRVRAIQLAEHPLCADHLKRGVTVAAECVDHIDGDPHNMDPSNLDSLCTSCHSIKTEKHDGGFGREVDRVKG